MSEVPLLRRIPPKSIDELAAELMETDADFSTYDAKLLATEMHTAMMEEIFRLARVGEEVERDIHGYGPRYQSGHLYMENPDLIKRLDMTDCEFGVQVAPDGRVWVCVNGLSWIRFKPTRS